MSRVKLTESIGPTSSEVFRSTSHDELETEIKEYLEERGFHTASLAYHDNLPREIINVLKRLYTPTTLYLRSRADRIAVSLLHKVPLAFEFEPKNHVGSSKHNMALEALPLIHHMNKARLGVLCLYAYRDIIAGIEASFWVGDHLHNLLGDHQRYEDGKGPINKVFLPNRNYTEEGKLFYKQSFAHFFPGVSIIETHTGGSGDPFVVIDEEIVRNLPSWKDRIDLLIEGVQKEE